MPTILKIGKKKMDFTLSDEQRHLQNAEKSFIPKQLIEAARKIERDHIPVPTAARKHIAKMGLLGINIAKDYGGAGLRNLEAILMLEEFAKFSTAPAFPMFENCVDAIKAIEYFGPENLKQLTLPTVCCSESVITLSMSEPVTGSAVTSNEE